MMKWVSCRTIVCFNVIPLCFMSSPIHEADPPAMLSSPASVSGMYIGGMSVCLEGYGVACCRDIGLGPDCLCAEVY